LINHLNIELIVPCLVSMLIIILRMQMASYAYTAQG